MPKKSKTTKKLGRSATSGRFTVVKSPAGREQWRISSGNKVYKVTSTATSTRIMDDAVRRYSNALERLAKK